MTTIPLHAEPASTGLPDVADDDALLERVCSHVVELASTGELPWIEWFEGLDVAGRAAIHERWPQASSRWQAVAPAVLGEPPADLLALRQMLLDHRAGKAPEFIVLCNLLASACFGPHHLWQDLGAQGRAEVSHLIRWAFPSLHAANTRNLRWKRHLFLVLGERSGQADMRPPKCDGCGDFAVCFGPVGDPPA